MVLSLYIFRNLTFFIVCYFLLINIAIAGNNINFADIDERYLIKQLKKNEKQKNSQKIKRISSMFLGNKYVANRLIGSDKVPEKLVIDFEHLDCFTFLDYVEALRRSYSIHGFIENIIKVRYFHGIIDFKFRKHFFSDWVSGSQPNALDVTKQVSTQTLTVTKMLNQKKNEERYLPGLPVKKRKITYIPSDKINEESLYHIKDGDYIGFFTKLPGIDVTHTGIFIRDKKGNSYLRNASSLAVNMRVVDSPFLEYVKGKTGIVIYRAFEK